MATSERRSKISEMEGQLRQLQESQRLRREQIEALETEQRRYAVDACVHKSADAQGKAHALGEESAKLRTDCAFADVAIEELTANLGTERTALRKENWSAMAGPLRRMLESRITGDREKKILDLALQLKKHLLAAQASDAEIAEALRTLHPLLLPQVHNVNRASRQRSDIISANLAPLVESPLNSTYLRVVGRDPREPAVACFGDVLESLEALSETEPEAEAATTPPGGASPNVEGSSQRP